MVWFALYLLVGIVVAAAAFVIANYVRTEDIVAPDSPGTASVVAGALWPIVIVGMTELALAAWLIPGRKAH